MSLGFDMDVKGVLPGAMGGSKPTWYSAGGQGASITAFIQPFNTDD
jgi:hypothetical protein